MNASGSCDLTLLVFSDPTSQLEDTGIGVFWLHCVD